MLKALNIVLGSWIIYTALVMHIGKMDAMGVVIGVVNIAVGCRRSK